MLFQLVLGASMLASTALPKWHEDDVSDNYHGTTVRDAFRWLEDNASPQTRTFIEQQNDLSQRYVATPLRGVLRKRLETLINYPRISAPSRQGENYIVTKNSGLQAQSVVYVRKGLDGEDVVLFDPNTFSADGTVALTGLDFTKDGSLVAYGKSVGGSDNKTVRIKITATGEDYPDVMSDMRFSSIAWTPDNAGFFYNKYPTGPDAKRINNKLYFHALGSEKDKLVYERPDDPELSLSPGTTEDAKWLVVYESRGTDRRAGVKVRPIDGSQSFDNPITLVAAGDSQLNIVGNDGGVFYALSDRSAPRRKLVKIDSRTPGEWIDLIPEPADANTTIDSIDLVGDTFIVTLSKDAQSEIELYALDGKKTGSIALPGPGTASVSAKRYTPEAFITFTSFTYPSTVLRYDMKSSELATWAKPQLEFDPAAYETSQVFFSSKDGTRVPMFIVHRKGITLGADTPALMTGYGGFKVGLSPAFSALRIAWLERGGVFAMVNLRGGDEYGEAWHEAGMLAKKQNVFDDFAAAGEYLIKNGFTSAPKLAIQGGSNGGLLVAASYVQHPELFGAVVCQVPVIDMLRYHLWGTGRFWTVEYGNAIENAEQFKFMYAYSPLHNIKPGGAYPPILVTTGDGDDRVVPANSLKFVAALQNQAATGNTVLLRYETGAGHGGGKPIAKVLDEQADVYAFLFKALNVKTND